MLFNPSKLLVPLQSRHDRFHLLITVYPKPLVLGDACELYVLAVQLLLHDLLERFESEYLGLGKGEGLVEFVLELSLRAFAAGTDGFGIVAVESTRGFGVVAREVLSVASSQSEVDTGGLCSQ